MSETTAASSTLTTREALTAAARRMQEFIEAVQRQLEFAHSLARLAQDAAEDSIVTAAQAGSLAETLIEHVWNMFGHTEGPSFGDETSRPWYYIERALQIDGEAGPEGPFIDREFCGNYDAIPIGELARLVHAITAAEVAAAEPAVPARG